MRGKSKAKGAPTKGQIDERVRSNESERHPTIAEIVHMEPVKATAIMFVSATDQMLRSDREKAIAAWAFANGMAGTLKLTERALGNFGTTTVFGSIAEAAPGSKGGHDDEEVCEICHQPWTAGDEFDKLERLLVASFKDKVASGRFDPMYS